MLDDDACNQNRRDFKRGIKQATYLYAWVLWKNEFVGIKVDISALRKDGGHTRLGFISSDPRTIDPLDFDDFGLPVGSIFPLEFAFYIIVRFCSGVVQVLNVGDGQDTTLLEWTATSSVATTVVSSAISAAIVIPAIVVTTVIALQASKIRRLLMKGDWVSQKSSLHLTKLKVKLRLLT